MTDTDEYLKEGIEILDGYHHLDGKNEALISMESSPKDNQSYYDEFQEDCCKSFQILRERAYVFINLLQLMVVSDMKELREEDIKYLINAMYLDMNQEQAQSEFKKLIIEASKSWYRKYDNLFHVVNDYMKG